MSRPKPTLPDDLREFLSTTGLPFHVEMGGHHRKIIVGGRLAGILPITDRTSSLNKRSHKNVMAQVRRVVRELKS